MLEFLKLQENTFGIDISDQSLKIIKLKKRGKSFKLASFGQASIKPGVIEKGVIQDEDALVKTINEACKNIQGEKLKTKYIIASMPEEKSFLQVIQMPKMEEKELTSAIRFEAENYIPLPISEVYLDFQTITPANDQNHLDVLIVGMPKKIINSYVSCFKKAGLTPLIFEVESQAIARALIKNDLTEAPTVLIDFGKSSTDFIVFSGRSIQFTCSIPLSSEQLTLVMAKGLDMSADKVEKLKLKYDISQTKKDVKAKKIEETIAPILNELVVQIKKYVNFYHDHAAHDHLTSQEKIKNIILCGGGANLKGLPEFLSKALEIPVQLGDFWVNIPSKKTRFNMSENSLSFITALGLALRGMNTTKN